MSRRIAARGLLFPGRPLEIDHGAVSREELCTRSMRLATAGTMNPNPRSAFHGTSEPSIRMAED